MTVFSRFLPESLPLPSQAAVRTVVTTGAQVISAVVLLSAARTLYREGASAVASDAVHLLRRGVPGLEALLQVVLRREARGALDDIFAGQTRAKRQLTLPATAADPTALLQEMQVLQKEDCDASDGKLFAYVYTTEGGTPHYAAMREAFHRFNNGAGLAPEGIERAVRAVYDAFAHENGLNPTAFPSLRRFETETISMVASLFNGDAAVVGTLTSGGTESILCVMKTYRDRARKLLPRVTRPEVVAPITVHPAFEKAAAYFDLKMVHVPVQANGRPRVADVEAAITSNTVLLVMSAPQYPHGIVDPIEDVAELALRRGLPLHVDACFGGFMLPWVEKLGYKVPAWDFRVKGVTSISADIHKYGWGVKGSSLLLFRTEELRRYLIFAYANWPGGLFASPSMAGTRPGGYIAASWASLMLQGEEGYLKIARQVMDTCDKMKAGIRQIKEVEIVGEPHMTAFAVKSRDPTVDMLAVADHMEKLGWKIERLQNPAAMHFSIMPHHAISAESLPASIAESVKAVKGRKELSKEGGAAMYGMVGTIPDKSLVNEFLVNLFSEIYTLAD